ncbi:MAG TPA: ABC transporter ATP-binding protein [Polyangiaceae bacterium]
MSGWADLGWREDQVSDALLALARDVGLVGTVAVQASLCPRRADDPSVRALAEVLGVEAEPVVCTRSELAATLRSFAPALLRIDHGDGVHLLTVAAGTAEHLLVLTSRNRRVRIAHHELAAVLTRGAGGSAEERVDRWLSRARIARRRRGRAREELLREAVGHLPIRGMWLLRGHPGASFAGSLRRSGGLRHAGTFLGAAFAQVALGVGAWLVLGRGALSGSIEPGWLLGWGLIVATSVIAQLVASWSAGRLAVDVGAALKQRLLCGALRVDPREVRSRGAGALLATVSESGTLESAGLSGALGAVTAAIQIASAAFVLAAGAGGFVHVALLALWSVAIVACAVVAGRARAAWTRQRFDLTSDYVEKVIGQRTRVVQQAPSAWHAGEDAQVDEYHERSRSMDRTQLLLASLPSRGWLILGLLGLLPALASGASDTTALAVAIAGILQAQAGFGGLMAGVTDVLSAGVAWTGIAELYRAAADREPVGTHAVAAPPAERVAGRAGGPVLEARGLSFAYDARSIPVLHDCNLSLKEGERVLLEGPSGGGKSTLLSLLTGIQAPTRGVVLLRGFDRPTVGALAWRQRIASAPQFHDNHVFSGTLAFNLLMGRAWPPSPADLAEAEAVCRELGLGGLLDRMPAKLDQIVGETGWQLSHGERSRVFLARAILQGSDVVVLDETFGALDPLTLEACLGCVKRRARSLVVVAHP